MVSGGRQATRESLSLSTRECTLRLTICDSNDRSKFTGFLEMTIRSRLVLALLGISVVLMIPFVLALKELNALGNSTRQLRQNEFAGSLLLGRMRDAAEELKTAEIMAMLNDQPAQTKTLPEAFAGIYALADTLRPRLPAGSLTVMDSAIGELRIHLGEYQRLSRIGTDEAELEIDSLFAKRLSPAIVAIKGQLPVLGDSIDFRLNQYFSEAAASANAAGQFGILGLSIAVLLVLAIAVWLTRSISEPVEDLEKAMSTVADGDLSYPLYTEARAPAEFSRLSRSYRSMVNQLAELDKLKAEFVSVASHELKTPINVIIGYLQLLDEAVYGELNPKQREVIQLLESQSQSLARLVHQLLDVSRFEAGGGRLDTRPIELDRFLSELEGSFTVLAIQRDVRFRVSRGAELPAHVIWDEDRMSEVVGNILSNAFKFTGAGGSVTLSVYTVDESVSLEVRDTGAGIAPEHLPRIFEKFYMAENPTGVSSKGSGLGLAIAREIVEAHAGSISVESDVGVGTTFVITLPREAVGGRSSVSKRRTPHIPVSTST